MGSGGRRLVKTQKFRISDPSLESLWGGGGDIYQSINHSFNHGKPSFNTDAKGWTWIFRNNKNPNSKNIDNPFNKDLERIATSFYVSNLSDSLDTKGLWKACMPYGRLVDAFIANKRSKRDTNPKTEPNPKNDSIPNFPYHQSHATKPSFADVTLNKQSPSTPTLSKDTARSISLIENDLITIEDSSTVLLMKLNEADTMSNMYSICKSEGFMDLSIHHVGGLWIWIQLSSPLSCSKFLDNDTIKSIYSVIKSPSPSFRVDERMIWLEISDLPHCAWGSNSYKKIASLFGKFKFFEDEETSMSLGKVCISTKSIQRISDTIKVEMEANHLDKDDTSVEDKENDDLDDIDGILKDLDNDTKNEENIFVSPNDVVPDQMIKQVEEEILKQPDEEYIKVSEPLDLSRPPGFENTKKTFSNNSKCSTNFARHHKKDIKGISLIHELNKYNRSWNYISI
ncbi:hypothetical protein Tco_0641393 [Tanacetum coccineum]